MMRFLVLFTTVQGNIRNKSTLDTLFMEHHMTHAPIQDGISHLLANIFMVTVFRENVRVFQIRYLASFIDNDNLTELLLI